MMYFWSVFGLQYGESICDILRRINSASISNVWKDAKSHNSETRILIQLFYRNLYS